MADIIKKLQLKRGLKVHLDSILVGDKKPLQGEPVWELDDNKMKIGDGIHDYADLPYLDSELTNYYTKEEINIMMNNKVNVSDLPQAIADNVLNALEPKLDDGLEIKDGKLGLNFDNVTLQSVLR